MACALGTGDTRAADGVELDHWTCSSLMDSSLSAPLVWAMELPAGNGLCDCVQ